MLIKSQLKTTLSLEYYLFFNIRFLSHIYNLVNFMSEKFFPSEAKRSPDSSGEGSCSSAAPRSSAGLLEIKPPPSSTNNLPQGRNFIPKFYKFYELYKPAYRQGRLYKLLNYFITFNCITFLQNGHYQRYKITSTQHWSRKMSFILSING